MIYQLDNFVFYETDGLARLLFQSKDYYIYVWLDKTLYIKALQICKADRDKNVEERLDSNGLLFYFNNEKRIAPATNNNVNIFSDLENAKFDSMFKYLGGLKENDEVFYQLNENERYHFNKMPKSKKYI